ncbi:MAG: ATP-dependent helicase [Sandaracinus sp.]|nr:ATP-dependent helicase [Sandaracinus sp.]MBJ71377.1 ATP-dependent helicase [Sandaracinus sp.]
MQMADAVEDALRHQGVLLVEAGTGTGKTWAYLLPALLSDRKVVVSTATRNLQDQIVEHDLPLLREHLGLDVDVAVMKGLSNYLCLRRFDDFRKSAAAHEPALGRELKVVESWRELTPSGDRAELPLPEDAAVWPSIASGPDTRIGARCSRHEDCFVTAMRRAAEKAQLVVVNHHLFFADLAMRGPHGGAVLPDYDAVIFDEAHRIEDVATLFFGTSLSTGQLERLAKDAARAILLGGGKKGGLLPENLRGATDAFFFALPRPKGGSASAGAGRTPVPPGAFTGELEKRFFALDDALEALGAHCRQRRAEHETFGQLARRCGQARDALGRITEGASGRAVAWVAERGHGVALGVSPVDVSSELRAELFGRAESVVLTSATLTTGGDFTFIEKRLGLDFEVDALKLDSPFDWPTQAGLYVPERMPDPRDPRWLEKAAAEILGLAAITDGGAFVLCTSFRNMRALAGELRATLRDRGYPVLVQGEAPKAALLERFREAGDAVLFATMSFWEGVDVPGEALRLVVLDKLPFAVPTDPLVRARCERLEEEGGKPFMELLVPSAALTLKQGFGRLVRTRRDRGVVAILDPRLVKKGYGKHFLRSLPDASRLYSLGEAQAFWELGDRLGKTAAPGA